MELTNENLILLDLKAENSDEVIEQIVEALNKEHRLKDKNLYKKDVYTREHEISTAMGLDIALPHARSAGVKYPSLVYVRLKNSVRWNDDYVSMVIGIAVPEEGKDESSDYLKILSKLARKLMDEDFRGSLKSCISKKNCVDLLSII